MRRPDEFDHITPSRALLLHDGVARYLGLANGGRSVTATARRHPLKEPGRGLLKWSDPRTDGTRRNYGARQPGTSRFGAQSSRPGTVSINGQHTYFARSWVHWH